MLSRLSRRIWACAPTHGVVDGVRWHWFEGGKGPHMVILHGLAAEGDHWLGVAGPLRKQFHVLVPDLPGFGTASRRPGWTFISEAQSLRLEALAG